MASYKILKKITVGIVGFQIISFFVYVPLGMLSTLNTITIIDLTILFSLIILCI